ncbi:MAG: hypothetical protein Q4C53_07420 [Clostridia bacterium]|nr:hypothetical protein [Clostridia bacterium]
MNPEPISGRRLLFSVFPFATMPMTGRSANAALQILNGPKAFHGVPFTPFFGVLNFLCGLKSFRQIAPRADNDAFGKPNGFFKGQLSEYAAE